MVRRPEKDLAECIEKILKDYPKNFIRDDLFETNQIRIRRRGPENFTAEDEVGLYSEDAFNEGKLTESKIREDIQKWIRLRGNKV